MAGKGDQSTIKTLTASAVLARILTRPLDELIQCSREIALDKPEALHQARAALRRLRTATVLFAPEIDQRLREGWTAELRRLGHILGEARNWDVFANTVLEEFLLGQPAAPWFQYLRSGAAVRRKSAYAAVEEELSGAALETLTISLSQWSNARFGRAGQAAGLHEPIEEVTPRLLKPMCRKVKRRACHIDSRDPRKLHAVRRSLKKLRYAAEELGGPYRRKPVKRYIEMAKRVEKCLGRMNDMATARHQLEVLAKDGGLPVLPAVATMQQWCKKRQKKAMARARPAWRKFAALRPFWR